MKFKSLIYSSFLILALSLQINASEGSASSPFLIPEGMPHYTGMLKKSWDDKILNLTQQQKEKLLIIRKKTMEDVMHLKPLVMQLQTRIKTLAQDGENPKKIHPIIEELSRVKAEATKVHINCIYETKKILTAKQLNYLMQK